MSHCTWCIYTSQSSIYRKNYKLYLGHCQEVMNEVSGGVTPFFSHGCYWLPWKHLLAGFRICKIFYPISVDSQLLRGFWNVFLSIKREQSMQWSTVFNKLYVINKGWIELFVDVWTCTDSQSHLSILKISICIAVNQKANTWIIFKQSAVLTSHDFLKCLFYAGINGDMVKITESNWYSRFAVMLPNVHFSHLWKVAISCPLFYLICEYPFDIKCQYLCSGINGLQSNVKFKFSLQFANSQIRV